MSESQNSNQNPNNADEEQTGTTGASSAPQDVSGSFKLAQNPDQFFQTSISVNETEGAMQTRSFSFSSSQFNPDPSEAGFNPNVVPGFNPEPSAVYNPEPSAAYNPEPSAAFNPEPSAAFNPEPSAAFNPEPSAAFNPEPSAAFNPEPSASPAPQTQPVSQVTQSEAAQPWAAGSPGMASHPDSSGAFNPDPAASFPGRDFFDNPGRQAQTPLPYATQPQVFNSPEISGEEPNPTNYASPARTQPQDGSRLPGGFFDVQENTNPSTAAGAPQNNATPQYYQNYTPGVTPQQAFFSSNDVPQLPAATPQANSSFQDFYQTPQAQQQPQPGQQQAPAQYQPHADTHQQPPNPETQFQGFSQQSQNTVVSQQSSAPNSTSNQPFTPQQQLNSNKDVAKAPPPSTTPGQSGKKKKRRPRVVEEKTTDYTQSEVELDNFKRFEKLVASPETKGLTLLAFHEAREILTQPEEFYKAMQTRGNIAEPAIFLFIVAGVSGLLAGIISTNLLITLQFMIGNILQAVMLSFICWKLYTGMGSTEPFETSFRVIAYSQASLIIAGLKFNILGNWIPAYITLAIATIIAIRLQTIGMKQVHELPTGKIVPVLVLATMFILLIRFKIFLL